MHQITAINQSYSISYCATVLVKPRGTSRTASHPGVITHISHLRWPRSGGSASHPWARPAVGVPDNRCGKHHRSRHRAASLPRHHHSHRYDTCTGQPANSAIHGT